MLLRRAMGFQEAVLVLSINPIYPQGVCGLSNGSVQYGTLTPIFPSASALARATLQATARVWATLPACFITSGRIASLQLCFSWELAPNAGRHAQSGSST